MNRLEAGNRLSVSERMKRSIIRRRDLKYDMNQKMALTALLAFLVVSPVMLYMYKPTDHQKHRRKRELMLRPEGHVIEEYSNVAYSGHWSIKFLIPKGHGQSSGHYDNPGFANTEAIEDGCRIILLGHGLKRLKDFKSLSFWYYFPYQAQLTHPTAPPNTVNEWNILPYVGIFLDNDGDGSADALLMSMVAPSGVTDAWTQHTVPDNWWGVYGTIVTGKANAHDMAWWKSQHGTTSIFEISLYWGYWAGTYAINDNIVYVDDIVINGKVKYTCERPV